MAQVMPDGTTQYDYLEYNSIGHPTLYAQKWVEGGTDVSQKMPARLPPPVPQIPVGDLGCAISFYQSRLGFALDWKYQDGLAGVSREEARLFLDRVAEGPLHPVRIWINLGSVTEVDALFSEWQKSGVPMASAPEQKPWGIYEFIAEDGDGNSFRVFYDTETPKGKG